jgi:hypothetical protein
MIKTKIKLSNYFPIFPSKILIILKYDITKYDITKYDITKYDEFSYP